MEQGRLLVVDAQKRIGQIGQSVSKLNDLIDAVTCNADQQKQQLDSVEAFTIRLDEFSLQNEHLSDEVIRIADTLGHDADYLASTVNTFSLSKAEFSHPIHQQMSERARDAATQIGTVLEKALRSGTLSDSDLFESVYEPVAGTDPQKYTTGFDRYCAVTSGCHRSRSRYSARTRPSPLPSRQTATAMCQRTTTDTARL